MENGNSFSIYIENNPQEKLLERKKLVWVDDDSVSCCYNCNSEFTWINRKSHCRYCGRIFCHTCSSNWVNASRLNKYKLIDIIDITDSSSSVSNEPYRVCKNCFDTIKKTQNVVSTIKTLEDKNLKLTDIKSSLLKNNNDLMIDTYNIYLANFRQIQYKLPNTKLTEKEKMLLTNNLELIIGHNKYMCQYLKNIHNPDIINILNSSFKIFKCFDLMCSRGCSETLTDTEVLDILLHIQNTHIRNYVLQFLTKDISKLECYIPILVFSLRHCPDKIIHKYLIKLSIQHQNIRYKYFWELSILLNIYKDTNVEYYNIYKTCYDELVDKIESLLGINEINKMLAGKNFFSSFYKNNLSDIKKNILSNQAYNIRPFPIPLNPRINLKDISFNEIIQKNSNSKPIIIPLTSLDNSQYKLLFKSEDVRKDQIISNIIKYMNILLKNEGLDLNLITYNVIPITSKSGLIEIVDNAETIYNIENKHGYSILNYIIEKNLNKTIDEIRESFCKSLAGYCIITYLLGIGDRHLNNIMITDDARIFHIDYSFILGKDPKSILASKIRITEGMINALGGHNSKYYKKFQDYCSKCYEILRKHTNMFINMLSLLTIIDKSITMEKLEKEVGARFQPAENKIQAEIQIIKMINSSQQNNLIDYFHNIGQWFAKN